jgi:hypothetical protein
MGKKSSLKSAVKISDVAAELTIWVTPAVPEVIKSLKKPKPKPSFFREATQKNLTNLTFSGASIAQKVLLTERSHNPELNAQNNTQIVSVLETHPAPIASIVKNNPVLNSFNKIFHISAESTILGAPSQSFIVASLNNPQQNYTSLLKAVQKDLTNIKFTGMFFFRNALITGLDETRDHMDSDIQQVFQDFPKSSAVALAATETILTCNIEYKELIEQTGKKFSPKPVTMGLITARNAPLYYFVDAQKQYLAQNPDSNPLAVSAGFAFASAATSLPFHSGLVHLHDQTTPKAFFKSLTSHNNVSSSKSVVQNFSGQARHAIGELMPLKALGARHLSLMSLFYPMAKNALDGKSSDPLE